MSDALKKKTAKVDKVGLAYREAEEAYAAWEEAEAKAKKEVAEAQEAWEAANAKAEAAYLSTRD